MSSAAKQELARYVEQRKRERTQWWPADKADFIVALCVSHLIAAFLGKAFL
jgi:hypothetical protein